jgi:ATP diphosphatase
MPELLAACDDGRTAVWLASDDDSVADAVAAEVVTRAERGDQSLEVEVLAGSYDEPGSRLLDLVEVMDRLRTQCPWDREQTHRSLVRYLVEESYETVEAIESGDRDHLREELGDLLLQVVFHARMAQEQDAFDFGDVVEAINTKLVRRHPHVFGEMRNLSPKQVEGLWERIKSGEKAEKVARGGKPEDSGALAGVPVTLPALTRALKLQAKAGKVGFDWNDPLAVLAKIREECDEIEAEIAAGERSKAAAEVGDLLFAVVNLVRHLDADPEATLRAANQKFARRFALIEQALAAQGKRPQDSTLAEMDALWDAAKAAEK